MTDTILADGFFFDKPREGAPSFVKGTLSIQVDRAIPFLETHKSAKGYVNLDLLVSKAGKPYLKLNSYAPKAPENVDRTVPLTPVSDMDFSAFDEPEIK